MTPRRSMRGREDKFALWPVWFICGLLVLGMVAISLRMFLDQKPKISDIAVTELPTTGEIRFRVQEFSAGQLRLFRIAGTGITLALKRLADHRVHAALSSCTVCSRQGHHSYAKKNDLLCGVCNQPMRFENDAVAARSTKGQCPLPEISVSEGGEQIVIATRDVLLAADRALMK